ncbi:MAG: DUF975 family protein [Fibrobacter sp.]|nr:DUF975 family protein [Fibrobacter sp.]
MNNREIQEFAWNAMSGRWLYGALTLILFLAVVMGISTPQFFMEEGSVLYQAWEVLCTPFTWVLWIGLVACYLNLALKAKPSYARLFLGYRSVEYFLRIVITEIAQYIMLILWFLLLIVPGIMKAYSYTMTELILVEHPEYSPLQTITASKEMMYGHRWEFFCLQARFWAWMLLVSFTFGIAALWVYPYYMTAKSKFYLELKERMKTDA